MDLSASVLTDLDSFVHYMYYNKCNDTDVDVDNEDAELHLKRFQNGIVYSARKPPKLIARGLVDTSTRAPCKFQNCRVLL